MNGHLVEQGLLGLANASKLDANVGHFGAAILAAHYFMHDFVVDRDVAALVTRQARELIAHNAHFFRPLVKDDGCHSSVDEIARALEDQGPAVRRLGHNFIFASLAIRALSEMDNASLAGAVLYLIRQFDGAGTGGPFPGWADPDIVRVEADEAPRYETDQDVARTALEAFASVERIYGGQHSGVVGHALTLGAACLDLQRRGYERAAEDCREAHRRYVKLMSRLEEGSPGALLDRPPASIDPCSAAYWSGDLKGSFNWAFGHGFKYVYAYCRLVDVANLVQADIERYRGQLAYLLSWR